MSFLPVIPIKNTNSTYNTSPNTQLISVFKYLKQGNKYDGIRHFPVVSNQETLLYGCQNTGTGCRVSFPGDFQKLPGHDTG